MHPNETQKQKYLLRISYNDNNNKNCHIETKGDRENVDIRINNLSKICIYFSYWEFSSDRLDATAVNVKWEQIKMSKTGRRNRTSKNTLKIDTQYT